jgi:outer membrane protein OmpA-like peptidoglycan-associated protein
MGRWTVTFPAMFCLPLWMAACASSPPASQKFVVFFEGSSAALDAPAQTMISTAAKWADEHPDEVVTVAGFADPEGSPQVKVAISRIRAQVVADQLLRDGVARTRIRMTAQGPTDFTLTSLESRRVEVAIAGL